MKSVDVSIRHGTPGDLEPALQILNHYILSSHCTFDTRPFSIDDRRGWTEHFSDTGRSQWLVAELQGEVLAYAHSMPFKPKPGYGTSVETTVYVDGRCCGQGLGERLLAKLLDNIRTAGAHRAIGAITLPNDASIALHLKLGYEYIGTFTEAGVKFGRFWDVGWYQKFL